MHAGVGAKEGSILLPWMIILVIQGFTWTPNRHLEAQISIFIDFVVSVFELPGINFGDIFVICL